MSAVSFDVVGLPAPQGSKRHVGNGVMVESSKKVGPWRDSVAVQGRDAWGDREALDGFVGLSILFRLPCPKSKEKACRAAGGTMPSNTRPDLDKLMRSTGDALKSAGIYTDDARVCSSNADKVITVGWTGASIIVHDLAAEQLAVRP